MNRVDLDAFLAEVLGDHLEVAKADLTAHVERLVAAKPLPPFVPPQPFDARAFYPAGLVVRHLNGIFSARRDTSDEPPSDAWLPLVVGVAGIDLRWSDSDRAFICTARLSDGTLVEHKAEIAVPIVRGYWNAELMYYPGDRVFRHGEHHCLKLHMGIDPTAADAAEHWQKVGGKHARDLVFTLDEATGDLSENGRSVGNVRRIFAAAVAEALRKTAA